MLVGFGVFFSCLLFLVVRFIGTVHTSPEQHKILFFLFSLQPSKFPQTFFYQIGIK